MTEGIKEFFILTQSMLHFSYAYGVLHIVSADASFLLAALLHKFNYHHRTAEDNEDYADGTVERFRACFICEL